MSIHSAKPANQALHALCVGPGPQVLLQAHLCAAGHTGVRQPGGVAARPVLALP